MKVKFLPLALLCAEGHKSQTRLVFKNTYGDAIHVRADRVKEIIDYVLMCLAGGCRELKIYVNVSFFVSSFFHEMNLLSIDLLPSLSDELEENSMKQFNFPARNLCVTNQSGIAITRFPTWIHDMNRIIVENSSQRTKRFRIIVAILRRKISAVSRILWFHERLIINLHKFRSFQ